MARADGRSQSKYSRIGGDFEPFLVVKVFRASGSNCCPLHGGGPYLGRLEGPIVHRGPAPGAAAPDGVGTAYSMFRDAGRLRPKHSAFIIAVEAARCCTIEPPGPVTSADDHDSNLGA